jgi:ABC-type cobalamin/Fe3+-siderophores transport system ATPase subunit
MLFIQVVMKAGMPPENFNQKFQYCKNFIYISQELLVLTANPPNILQTQHLPEVWETLKAEWIPLP